MNKMNLLLRNQSKQPEAETTKLIPKQLHELCKALTEDTAKKPIAAEDGEITHACTSPWSELQLSSVLHAVTAPLAHGASWAKLLLSLNA